jgi:Tfp pilus assembly PilM family ATPase
MAIARRRNSSPLIAIDFGVYALKAMQVSGGNGDEPLTLTGCGRVEVPVELYDKPNERLAFQADHLQGLLNGAGMKAKRAACSVSAGVSLVQHLRVQGGDAASTKSQIETQLGEKLGVFPGSCIVRHHAVGEVHHHSRKWTEMLVTVMPRETVLAHMNALRACKLEVVGVHSEHTALVHLLEGYGRFAGSDAHQLYLDFGYGTTKVVIAKDGETALARTIGMGGLTIDRALARERSCSSGVANQQRRRSFITQAVARQAAVNAGGGEHELAQGGSESVTNEPGETVTGRVGGATSDRHDVMDSIGEEVWACMRHFGAVNEGAEIDRAVLIGGDARDRELVTRVARMLDVPAQVLDPFALIGKAKKIGEHGMLANEPHPGMAVALGLCLAPSDI